MEIIFEIIIGAIWEVLVQVLGQLLIEMGFYSLGETLQTKKERNPFFSVIGYLLWGAILGGISLWIFPSSFIANPKYRVLNLVITPLMAGLAMALVGNIRKRKGQDIIKLDTFFYGAVFALSTTLIRYFFAT